MQCCDLTNLLYVCPALREITPTAHRSAHCCCQIRLILGYRNGGGGGGGKDDNDDDDEEDRDDVVLARFQLPIIVNRFFLAFFARES